MSQLDLLNHLAQCQAAELIRQVQVEPELEYWFRHTLVQEAAYESLLKSARAELHGRVAQAIEAAAGGSRGVEAAVLAIHYEAAGMDAKALPCAIAAADRARQTYAHQEALGFYGRALEMAQRLNDPGLGAQIRTIYGHRGRVLEVMGDHPAAEANYKAMLVAAERAGDVAMQADAMNHLTTLQALRGGQAPELPQQMQETLRLATLSGEPLLEIRALWNMGIHARFRDPLAAIDHLERALALAQAAPPDLSSRELSALVLNDLSIGYIVSGQFRRALAARTQAIAAFRALDNRPMLADALGGTAILQHYMGNPEQARINSIEGTAISQAIDNPWGVVYNAWSVQEIELDAGAFEASIAHAEQRIAAARKVGFPVFVGLTLWQAARAYGEVGQIERSKSFAKEAATHFAVMNMPSWTTWGQGAAGYAALIAGDLRMAQETLEPLWCPGNDPVRAFQGYMMAAPVFADWALLAGRLDLGLEFCDWMLDRLTTEDIWRCAGEMHFHRGRLRLAAGDLAGAEADLMEGRRHLTAARAASLIWKTDAARADVHQRRGNTAAEGAARESAAGGIARLAEGIRDDGLRHSFLGRADVRKVLAS
jgi:tetratricopeptide (TPR) repeat protein